MSVFSKKFKFIFIHIPKNAGSSFVLNYKKPSVIDDLTDFEQLNVSLGYEKDKIFGTHFTYKMIKKFTDNNDIDIDYENYFKFCVVRNPWERMVSLYEMRLRKIDKTTDGKPRNTVKDKKLLRQGFMPWLLTTQHVGDMMLTKTPQVNWIIDADKNIVCDKIIRIENYNQGINEIVEFLGLPKIQMKKYNVSVKDSGKYKDYYSDDGIKHIEKYFEEDIDAFKFIY